MLPFALCLLFFSVFDFLNNESLSAEDAAAFDDLRITKIRARKKRRKGIEKRRRERKSRKSYTEKEREKLKELENFEKDKTEGKTFGVMKLKERV